ncbi:chorion peroxidase [Trichonephila clavipes]|nr:chorion peroxidase [Trichonephila clavipes]
MTTFKVTRQVANPNFAYVVRTELATMCFVSYNVANAVAVIHEIADDPNQCHDDDAVQCDPEYPYRTFNGTCNNLDYPLWGRANECFLRILPAFYDGFEGERKSTQGGPLPQPRDITLNIVSTKQRLARKITYMFSVYGQTVAHDCSMAPEQPASVSCCGPESKNDAACISIAVRPDDPFFSKFNITCLKLFRTQKCDSCNTEKREQINRSTASLDASIVYGTNDDRANSLRTLDGTGYYCIFYLNI